MKSDMIDLITILIKPNLTVLLGNFFYCYAHELSYLNNTMWFHEIFRCIWTLSYNNIGKYLFKKLLNYTKGQLYNSYFVHLYDINFLFFSFQKGWKFLPSHRTSWPQTNDQPCGRQFVGAFLADRNRMCPRFFRRPWCLLAYENDGIR